MPQPDNKQESAMQEPLWKEEFSIFQADEQFVSRRQLIKFLTLTSFGMFIGNMWILVKSWFAKNETYPRQAIARAGEVPIGGVKLFHYPNEKEQCLLVRTATEEYVAYSQKCTHLSCAVYYSREDNQLICPCHNGRFSIRDGAVIQGPPTRPLPRVMLERSGEQLIAIGMKTKTEG